LRGATRIYHFTLGFGASMVVSHIIGRRAHKTDIKHNIIKNHHLQEKTKQLDFSQIIA